MEYVGRGKKVENEPVPFISIPTTAGTGSEVTKNSVLGSKVQTFKRSMRSDMMLANLTIVDPELSRGCPKKVTASSGIDAMTHLIEAYTTWRATPISDGLALRGIELAGRYLRRAYDDGNDMEAREGMAAAACWAACIRQLRPGGSSRHRHGRRDCLPCASWRSMRHPASTCNEAESEEGGRKNG